MPASECAAQLYLDGMVQRTKSIELAMPARSPGSGSSSTIERRVAAEHVREAEHMPVSECARQRQRNNLDGAV